VGALRKRVPLVNNLAYLVYGKTVQRAAEWKKMFMIWPPAGYSARTVRNVIWSSSGRGDLLKYLSFIRSRMGRV
jgi:hypothetical protein